MEIRWITPDYAVSPQISPADVAELAQAGFTTVISNRPDAEVPAELSADALRAACDAAGLGYVHIPATHDTLGACVAPQAAAIAEAGGKVLAYCASGTRSTFVWALGQAGKRPAAEIIAAGAEAGYDLRPLEPALTV